jgi:hypothetical protein
MARLRSRIRRRLLAAEGPVAGRYRRSTTEARTAAGAYEGERPGRVAGLVARRSFPFDVRRDRAHATLGGDGAGCWRSRRARRRTPTPEWPSARVRVRVQAGLQATS